MAETEDPQRWEESREQRPTPFAPDLESDEESKRLHTETSRDARNLAMLCHLLGIVGFVAPLVIWLSERDKHRFVDEHGTGAMDYQLSILIYFAVAWLSCFIYIGLILTPLLGLAHMTLSIVGALRARNGRPWRYPIAIRFLR